MTGAVRQVIVTGASGFVGQNLLLRLSETGRYAPVAVSRTRPLASVEDFASTYAVVHLAGANRPTTDAGFEADNVGFTKELCQTLAAAGSRAPILFSSSTRAGEPTTYGQSKLSAETLLLDHARSRGSVASIYRLPNVFGKWSRPNYNSAVATFCSNVSRNLPIQVNDPNAPLTLVYVDDVVDRFIAELDEPSRASGFRTIDPMYQTTVGVVADTIKSFRTNRDVALVDTVGHGLTRALYATYVSMLDAQSFAYPLKKHEDPRGWFSEFVKTPNAGQVSVFTAHPGITRGGHYHHTKTEKFLVVQGEASFRFRHVQTGAVHEVRTTGAVPTVVETVPGWAHDVTNIGTSELICVLWANELFDPARPDTIAHKV